MTIKNLYPDSRPSLDLNFAATKRLDPRVTFSRLSTATYYDGHAQVKAEENLLPYSQDFADAAWQKFVGTVTSNDTTAPDGTATADTFLGDVTTGTQGVRGTRLAFAGSSVISVFAKAGTASVMQIAFDGDVAPFANFDLSTGTVGTVGTGITASVIDAKNGWYRCVAIITSGTATNAYFTVQTSTSATRLASTTSPGSISLWGAQYEQRAELTAYTPTVASVVSRYVPQLLTAEVNQPRFDHSPATGESFGLLVEKAATNLLLQSDNFGDGYWTKVNATVSDNQIVSPTGAVTTDALVENSATGSHSVGRSLTALAAGTYVFSVFAKARERTNIQLIESSSTNNRANFNLSTGTIANSAGSPAATIQPVGNGWYRCSIQATIGAGGSIAPTVALAVDGAVGSPTPSYTGDGRSGAYLWGAQVELDYVTSHIPTTTATVTRSSDVATITGSNFSSWFNPAAGTICCKTFAVGAKGSAEGVWSVNGGTTANEVSLYNVAPNYYRDITKGSNGAGTGSWMSASINPVFTGIAYDTDGAYHTYNGRAIVSVSNNPGPLLATRVQFGREPQNRPGSTRISRFTYWPLRLSDASFSSSTL